jgi:uncharacterized protein YdeI (YjbR/CyaY-like superfamily)
VTTIFFSTAAQFRRWLHRHHATAAELWVGFHKKDSGLRSITYPEALDQALCYGWIDGLKKKYNDTSYHQRFTPRRPRSYWSAINIRRAGELIKLGLMTPAGRKAFDARSLAAPRKYSFESRPKKLGAAYEGLFKTIPAAWAFFRRQPPGYRRTAVFWVMSAKKDETRIRRLMQLMDASAADRRLGMLSGEPAKK